MCNYNNVFHTLTMYITVERTLHVMDNLYLTNTAYGPTTYKCVQIDLYIKDTSLLRTLMLVPKCP